MKTLFLFLLLSISFAATPALAQEKKEMTAQQKKMGSCSAQAKGLKGDEYKKKRDDCLKSEKDGKSANQAKFGKCSSELKGQKLSKPERSDKMKACMAKA